MKGGIQLPTIVVLGDQSVGKSSVLESTAGIELPRGDGMCTRVPLIMQLQHHPTPTPVLSLHYDNNFVSTDETQVGKDIEKTTLVITKTEKGVYETPFTLVIKKNGVPDLTMIDLPGITSVRFWENSSNWSVYH
ncbi:putative dynamin-related protein 4A [Chenopodium quinoa]|uniref:putative dynamin-related protein 4A n=1 Tax=Chenopodium quinoa TaxID=63459 RepID=UPI000B797FF6|nr:putative dynamin-related protein 4A [Chenopodium quinoa]